VNITIVNNFAELLKKAQDEWIENTPQAEIDITNAIALNDKNEEAKVLETEIQKLRKLDAQLEELMKKLGVTSPANGKAVNPTNCKLPKLQGTDRSDFVGANSDAISNLQKQYEVAQKQYNANWLNEERKEDFRRLVKKFY
jgi:hypothetical protein